MAEECNCLSFTFECKYESTFVIDLNWTGSLVNGRKYYVGTFSSIEYELYWDVSSKWFFKQTNPSFPEIVMIGNQDAQKPCIIPVINWVLDDTTNFKYCPEDEGPSSLASLTIPSECPSPTPTPTPTITPTPTKTPKPSPIPKFINECEPITIFDMGVSCSVVQPSTSTSYDGAASLVITGGTPPYTITWDNGNSSSAIGNLSVGSYPATVVDFYGDFTAKTICVLTGQTIPPTPTPTPTASPIPTGPIFCMELKGDYSPKEGETYTPFYLKQTFTVDSFINGKSSWLSNNSQYRIYWKTATSPNSWVVSASTTPFPYVFNTNPTSPPTTSSDWQGLSFLPPGLETTITEGPCEIFGLSPFSISNPNIELYVYKNDTVCGCDGSIVLNADGGNTPYEYSIDNGVSFSSYPIFDNVCSGKYSVVVKDYSGYTKSSQLVINNPKPPVTYEVNLSSISNTIIDNGVNLTKTYQSQVNVNPPLPEGVTLTFDLIHTNSFQTSITPNSAQLTTNSVLEKNNSPIPYTSDLISSGSSINIKDGCQDQFVYVTGITETWQSLTLTSTDNIIINTTTELIKNFTNECDLANSQDNYLISNLKITGCNCCTVQNLTL